MRRIGLLLVLVCLAIAVAGCGGSFLGLKDRQGYVLITPASIRKVFLRDGTTGGADVTLDAPQGVSSIAFRANTGELYGMGRDLMLYRVSAINGGCTVVSPNPLAITTVDGQLYSNADGSKLYYIGSDGTTYEISPTAGTLTRTGTNVAYAAGDPHSNPGIGGATFSKTGQHLYFLDSNNSVLAHMDGPLTGVLTTFSTLGVTVTGQSGLAIDPQLNKLYMVFNQGPSAGLYQIDPTSGTTTQIGGSNFAGTSIAIIP